jgi:hypothetical protein
MRRPAANAHRVQQAAQRDVAQVAKVIAVQEAQIAALQAENERLILENKALTAVITAALLLDRVDVADPHTGEISRVWAFQPGSDVDGELFDKIE